MFKIYIDRLKTEKPQAIEETVDPSFLEVEEEALKFHHPVTVIGQAYLATPHCIITLKIDTKATIPCCVCNENIEIPLHISPFTLTIELSEIKSKIYDFTSDIRDTILLKAPHFAECGGDCPHRKELEEYLKKNRPASIIAHLESN